MEQSRRRFLAGCCAAGAGALAAGGATAAGATQAVPETRWDRTYDSGTTAEANGVAPAGDGGFVVVGTVEPADSETDRELWLYKIDAAGRLVWERTVAEDGVTEGFDVAAVGDGEFVVAGHTHVPGESAQDAIALLVAGDGTEQWRRTFNARPGTTDTMRTVTVDPQGRFLFAGWTSRFDDAWVARLDDSGSIGWAETYGPGEHNRFHGAVPGDEGGYVLVGETDDNSDNTTGWAVKLDEGGTQQFSQQFKKDSDSATNPVDDYNVFFDVSRTRNGYVAVGANAFDPETNDRRGWALEFNVNGGKLWDKRYSEENFTALRSVTSGNLEYYVAGETATDADGTDARGYAANLGIDGQLKWSGTWGSGSSEFSEFHLTEEEGMVCLGSQADSAGADTAGWGVKLGGEAVATDTPTATPSPTPSPTGSPTVSPSPTFSPTPSETVGGTDAAGGDGGTDAAPTPTATPGDSTARPGGPGTTTGGGSGGGLSLTTIGIGVVILALGGGGLLYNQYVAGGTDEGAAGSDRDTGGGGPTDTGDDGGGGSGGVETTEPEAGNEAVQGAQTVVEETGDTGGDGAEGSGADAAPDESAEDGTESDPAAEDDGDASTEDGGDDETASGTGGGQTE